MMCLKASASHTGRGTGSRCKTPRLTRTTPVSAQLRTCSEAHVDYCGGTTLPAEDVDPANGAVLTQLLNSRIVGNSYLMDCSA